MKPHIQIVASNSAAVTRSLNSKVSQAIASATFSTEAGAKIAAPVDTGALRNSITSEIEPMRGSVSVGVEYAAHVEFGTSHQAAQPYLMPAFRRASSKLRTELRTLGWSTK